MINYAQNGRMMKTGILCLLVSLLALASCGVTGSNEKDKPRIPGKIVFAAKAGGTSQIFTMNANGSHLRQLTHFSADPDHGASQPSWSPDGSRIIFSSGKKATSDGPALWVMNADGSNKHVLYDPKPNNINVPPLAGRHASWSPDGSKIVFDLCALCAVSTNSNIYIFNTKTKQVKRLTEFKRGVSNTYPVWSPDGTRISFTSDRAYSDDYAFDLYVYHIKNGELERLTKTGDVSIYTWKNIHNITYRPYGFTPILKSINTLSEEIDKIKLKQSFEGKTQIVPFSWYTKDNLLLALIIKYGDSLRDGSDSNELAIINIKTSKVVKRFSKISSTGFISADWFIPDI